MTPDSLRTLSLRTFKATIYCGVAGIVVLIGAPNPSFREAADPAIRIIAYAGFALLAVAALTNFVSLVSGAVAWARGAQRCPWIVVSALVLLVPAGIWIAVRLNL
jgi:hypothetical protein